MLDKLEGNMKVLTGKQEPLKKSLCLGDTGYYTENNLQEAANRNIEVIIPDPQFRQRDPVFSERQEKRKRTQRYTLEDFAYDKKRNCYFCPNGKALTHRGKIKLRNNEGHKYQAFVSDCSKCRLIEKCMVLKHRPSRNERKYSRALYVVDRKYADNLCEKMKHKIDDPAYKELYSRRQQIIEPVFANMVYCKGMDRFTFRGKAKVNTQLQLYCMVHNISKCVGKTKAIRH